MLLSKFSDQVTPILSLIVVLVLGLTLSNVSYADTLYVGNNGNDGRSRNQARNRFTPWRTIQRAVNEVNPGDTIVVRSGTYNELVRIRRSGQANRLIELRSEGQHGARLLGDISVADQSYITVSYTHLTLPTTPYV